MNPHVFAVESCVIAPYDDHWMPFTWNIPNNCSYDLFASPIRRPITTAEGIYTSALYSILSKSSDHINIINPSSRPIKFHKGEVIATVSPFAANTRYSYINLGIQSSIVPSGLLSPRLGITFTVFPCPMDNPKATVVLLGDHRVE